MNDLESLKNPVLSHATLVSLLSGYARPNDKISQLISAGKLVALKRGLYLVAGSQQRSLELIANHLYGPSYVSRHWALSGYGLFSEQVFVITSMCLGRSRQFETAQRTFHYQPIPARYYSVGIESVQRGEIAFMMATPEKALADLLVSTCHLRVQSVAAMLSYLQTDLRLDDEALSQTLLQQRIQAIDFEQAKQDVFPFIPKNNRLDIWSQTYFSELILKINAT